MKKSAAQKIFDLFNTLFMVIIALVTLYPFLYTVGLSFSTAAEAARGGLHIIPRSISLNAYVQTFQNAQIFSGFKNTLFKTVAGTFLSVLATSSMAYALAHRRMPFKKTLSFLVTLTMIFSAGMVPTYILISKLGLINNYLVYILPSMIIPYNLIILKSNFKALPVSLLEAAQVDGANEITTFFRIVLPISKAPIATVALWVAVRNWNEWMDGLLYITDNKMQILQIILQRIIENNVVDSSNWMNEGASMVTPETLKSATIVVTMFPILCVYPFIQKYFVKGVTLGAVKE